MPPLQFWFTGSTLTLWVAVVAAISALYMAANSDWQTSVKEQLRITAEETAKSARELTLATILNAADAAEAIRDEEVTAETYQAWKAKADEFWGEAQTVLKAHVTPAELAVIFASTGDARFVIGSLDREHSGIRIALGDMAEKLRNIALKYS